MAFWQIGWCTPPKRFFSVSFPGERTISLGIFSRSSSGSSNWLFCCLASCTRRTAMNWLVVLYTPGCCTLWPAMRRRQFRVNLFWNFANPKLTFAASLLSISANRFNPLKFLFMIRPNSFLEIRYFSVVVVSGISVTPPDDDVPLPTAPDCTTTAGYERKLRE